MDSGIAGRRKELAINTVIFGFGTLVSKLLMFVLLPIYTSSMTASELGTGELVVTCMNLLYPIATMNVLSALLRYAMDAAYNKNNVLGNTILIALLGLAVVSSAVVLIRADSSVLDWKFYLILLLVSYVFDQILAVFSKALDKTLDFAIGNILYTLGLFVFSIVLIVFLERGVAGYLESMIAANWIATVYFAVRLNVLKHLRNSKIDRCLLREMVLFSLPLIINSLSWWIACFSDRFLLEYFLGSSAVGLYSVASKIPTILITLSSVFMQAWVLSAIKEYESGCASSFFDNVFRDFYVAMSLASVLIICFSEPLMRLLAVGDFADSWVYVPLLVCASLFEALGSFFAVLYTSAKRNVPVMASTLFGAIVNIALNIALIPAFGIQGAVFATMASKLGILFYRVLDIRRFVDIKVNYAIFIINLVLVFVECISVVFVGNILIDLIVLVVCVLTNKSTINTFTADLLNTLKRRLR